MHILHDPDQYEAVITSRPCTVCAGDPHKCNGACNGSSGATLRRRSSEEIARIKGERLRREEDEILARAEVIRALRAVGATP